MGDTKPFQIIFISICVVLTIAGVFVFSFGGAKKKPDEYVGPTVVIWGTEDEKMFNDLIKSINTPSAVVIKAEYVQKDKANFNQTLLEALSIGRGPDVILVPTEDLLTYKDKIVTISFDSLNERTFKDSFIEQAELLRTDEGFLGLPFSIDPLVLYWNRDLFTIHNKTAPPSNWNTVVSMVPEMRDISEDLTVFEAVISLGDYRNITNAKAIFSALMLQSGTPITTLGTNSNDKLNLISKLDSTNRQTSILPAVAALNFYTQFADPLSKVYSWNRSLPQSLDMFASDDLAMYIGFGSEADLIRAKNPNLNFDMALLPQSDSSPVPVTYGNMYSMSILSSSNNATGAFRTILALSGTDFLKEYAKVSGLPPVRRDLLATPPGDAESAILYRSALYSRGFFDPSTTKTNTIFQTMIEAVLAGRMSSSEAVQTADRQLRLLTDEFNQKQEELE